jgi:uncharacterized protein (DUF2252 family)
MASLRPQTQAKGKARRHVDRFVATRPTLDERLAAGKALRDTVPREQHAIYVPRPGREDPVRMLELQNASRLPQLVPVRYARMLESPFAFLRGSAAVMAADLAPTPATGALVQACGDMHVANFGVYASAERRLVFGINDFDETFPAPWEWDLKRLAASAAVVARQLGGKDDTAADAARHVARSCSAPTRKCSRRWPTWSTTSTASSNSARSSCARPTPNTGNRCPRRSTISCSRTWKSLNWDRRRLLERYQILDVARKVVGVGSVGTRCWVILMKGLDDSDPLFLQIKEAQTSVLQPYGPRATHFANEGHRVVAGQRMIQGSPDIFLGWGELGGVQFYVRQLRDMKGGAEFREGRTDLDTLPDYCQLCGWALALAHAKSGDAATIAGYVGKSEELDDALASFSLAYADQTWRDHDLLVKAAASGRIEVAQGRA